MKTKEFTRRLKAELNQTEHLNIYEVPCPKCGATIVTTAKVRDDNLALSRCSAGHEFTRANAFDSYNATVRARVQINAVSRLKAYDKTWITKMDQHKKAHPKYQGKQKPSQLTDEHIFTLEPAALAQQLKSVYKDDFRGAMGALTMYKNRAGKTLLSPDRDRIDKAKEQLRKLYGKQDEDQRQSTNPRTEPADARKSADERSPIGSKPTTKTI